MDIRQIIRNKDRSELAKRGIEMLLSKPFLISERTSVQYKFIAKKAERISVVVLILISDFDKSHPVYQRCADLSLRLVEEAVRVPYASPPRPDAFVAAAQALRASLSALAHAALLPGSSMRVVLEELDELASFTEHAIAELSERSRPDLRAFLRVDPPPPVEHDEKAGELEPGSGNARSFEPEDIKDTLEESKNVKDTTQSRISGLPAENLNSLPQGTPGVSRKKDRRALILSMLQRKDQLTVKDVSSLLKDVSEKTIQRELLALVAQGVLKKHGERRWSAYSLA